MKTIFKTGGLFAVCLTLMLAIAPAAEAQVKAFPTAEGFGANTVGGRGGRVIEVTNLADSGAGSLRACAEATGARTCIFRMGGTIALNSPIHINAAQSFLTIAGQTAPGGGVQVKNWYISIANGAHDVIIRYLKVRQGTDASPQDINNDCGGIIVYGGGGIRVYNVIVDHVSLSWACDDLFQFYGTVQDVTLQWSLLGEGLTGNDYKNAAGVSANSKGFVAAGNGRWSAHHNLMIHSESRNPLSKGERYLPTLDYRNNVIYNWGGCQGSMQLGLYHDPNTGGGDSNVLVNMVGNKAIPGPNTPTSLTCFVGTLGGTQTKIYFRDNWTAKCKIGCSTLADMGFITADPTWTTPASDAQYKSASAFAAPAIIETPLSTLEGVLAAGAGSTKPTRDSLDTRLTNEFQTRTGNIGRNGAPWPVLAAGTPPADADHDGMPDAWESARGLNPNNAADGASTASNGYTNLENYLNNLAGDPTTINLPDVIVTALSYANGTFTATIKNQGTAATSTGVPIEVGFFADTALKIVGSVPGPLAAGASITVSGSSTLLAGTYSITAYTDNANRFAESNETNNQSLPQSITVGQPP